VVKHLKELILAFDGFISADVTRFLWKGTRFDVDIESLTNVVARTADVQEHST
jgi:hypothetical protein